LTPNILARTIETVEGGGLIIILIKAVSSLKQLYTLNMDVHKKLKTEAHQNVVCRFNERLILSLSDCDRCLLLNDDLTILPLSAKTSNVKSVEMVDLSPQSGQLKELQEKLQDTPLVSPLVKLCKTYDQARAVTQFIDALAEKELRYL
jgi:N-acetyltransferase 10